MKGWFDAFRENGGPTLYAHANRTPVIGDVSMITLCVVFGTLYFAFFVIFPGIRKERFTTFLSVTLSLFVGTAILLGNNGSSWHRAEAEVSSAYRAFSNEKLMGKVGVYIGLAHANVTLMAMPIYYNRSMDINFNERFEWGGPTQLQEEYRQALVKGLPFPILTVAEYLAVDAEGFCWGRNYREAGYFTSIFLWTAFILWIIMNILLVVVPRYGAYMMTMTGFMMIFSTLIYYWLLPGKPLVIHIEDVTLTFELGWCFYLVLIAGLICAAIGGCISIIDLIYPHKFSTILEMDYGTPFDRHTIIEDSHETKKKKKTLPKLEEPATVGFGGLLRRLSKRDRSSDPHQGAHDNYAFEMEAPKSPWRYPHLMFRDSRKSNKSVSFKRDRNHLELPGQGPFGMMKRTDSKDSECSSINSVPYQGREDLRATISVPPSQKFQRTDSSESSTSSLASFGGLSGILSRANSKNKNKKGLSEKTQVTIVGHTPVERHDSGQSVISRGYVVTPGEGGMVTVVSTGGGGSSYQAPTKNDEVSIIVSGRKDSVTEAKRRNSAEHQRSEASMW
eukprot:maker-scaffold587_size153100-snap-gene-0.22 protein:Tk01024 transcript:maker-scaffold587_size153100-snap-gene-0.22-mRNA-1 annotation:"moladietz"